MRHLTLFKGTGEVIEIPRKDREYTYCDLQRGIPIPETLSESASLWADSKDLNFAGVAETVAAFLLNREGK